MRLDRRLLLLALTWMTVPADASLMIAGGAGASLPPGACLPATPLAPEDLARVHFAHPRWSPVDDVIALDCGLGDARELCLLDPATRAVVRLTDTPDNEAVPVFSPDGRSLSYSVNREGSWRLALLDLNTGVGREVGPIRGEVASSTAWSRDGRVLAFDMPSEAGDHDIYTVSVEGGDAELLVGGPGSQRFPSWSPDGSALAYHETIDGNTDIVVAPSRDGVPSRPAATPGTEALPMWSPDGGSLSFYSNRTGRMEVFAVELAGESVRQLTDHDSFDLFGVFSRDGASLVFESTRERDPASFDRGADLFRVDLESMRVQRLTRPDDFPSCIGPFPAPSWTAGAAAEPSRAGRYSRDLLARDVRISPPERAPRSPGR